MAKEEKPVEGGDAPKKSKKLLIIILALLVVVLGGGVGALLLLKKSEPVDEEEVVVEKEKPKKKKKGEKEPPPVFVAMDPPFTVNLAPGPQGGGDQYLQVALSLQVEDAAAGESMKAYTPKLRNKIMLLLSSKTAAELLTTEGKAKLAGEIREEINMVLDPPPKGKKAEFPVIDVLFTSFIIQ